MDEASTRVEPPPCAAPRVASSIRALSSGGTAASTVRGCDWPGMRKAACGCLCGPDLKSGLRDGSERRSSSRPPARPNAATPADAGAHLAPELQIPREGSRGQSFRLVGDYARQRDARARTQPINEVKL